MGLPRDPQIFGYAPDPGDMLDYGISIAGLLADGEALVPGSATVTLSADAAGLGLVLSSDPARAPGLAIDGATYVFWLGVDVSRQADSSFTGFGVEVSVVLRFSTNAVPPRSFEREAFINVRNR